MFFRAILHIGFLLLTTVALLSAVSFPGDWNFRAEIQIDGSLTTTTHSNFPIVLRSAQFPAEMLNNNGLQDAMNGGLDVRFSSDAQGSQRLACEIVRFSTGATPAVEVWVKLNTLTAGASNSIYVWWGASGATLPANGSTYGRNAVWSNNFTAVYHLNEIQSGAAGNYQDSTGNFNSLATTNPPTRSTGSIGFAATFNANNNQEIVLPNTLDTTGNYTLQGWVSTSNMSGFRTWLGKSDTFAANNSRWRFYNDNFGSSNPGIGRAGSEASWANGGDPDYTGTAAHFNMVVTTGVAELIHNGTSYGTRTFTQGTDAAARVTIGNSAGEFWTGTIDEVRIVSTNRSQSWINTEYINQQNPGTFFTNVGPIINVSTRYWIGNNTNWNDPANWSNSSGGPSGASIPDSGTSVIFDANSNNMAAVFANDVTITSLSVNNYNGTINSNNFNFTISGQTTCNSGTVNVDNAVLSIQDANYGSTLLANNTTINLNGNLDISGSITHTNGVLICSGTNQTISLNGNSIASVSINGSGVTNLSSNAIINNQCIVTSATLQSSADISFAGDLTANNTISLTGNTFFTGTSIINGSQQPNIDNIIINTAATLTNNIDVFTNAISVNGLLVNNGSLSIDNSFNIVDFNSVSITSYGNQDNGGTATIEDSGATLFLEGNTWKKINVPSTVTANTYLNFDFRSTIQAEIQGIGIDANNQITAASTFKLFGTQNWGNDYTGYTIAQGWVHYQIPLGSLTGSYNFITFLNDHDTGAQNGNSRFRNVFFSEGIPPQLNVVINASGTLSGNGVIIGTVNAINSATISPGDSNVGTIQITDNNSTTLDLDNDSELIFDLGSSSDLIELNGNSSNLTLDGNLFINNSGGLSAGNYTLITFTGTVTDNTLNIASMPLGFDGSINITANTVELIVTEQIINIIWTDTLDIANKSWALGVMVAGAQSAPSNWSIRNAGNVNVDLDISSANSIGAGWTSSAAAGLNQYVINVDTDNNNTQDVNLATSQLLSNALAPSADHAFNMWFTCPTMSSTAASQSIAITIIASPD